MADEKDTAFIFTEGAFEFILGVHIQMIGRLVQKQDVGFSVNDFTETDFGLLTTA